MQEGLNPKQNPMDEYEMPENEDTGEENKALKSKDVEGKETPEENRQRIEAEITKEEKEKEELFQEIDRLTREQEFLGQDAYIKKLHEIDSAMESGDEEKFIEYKVYAQKIKDAFEGRGKAQEILFEKDNNLLKNMLERNSFVLREKIQEKMADNEAKKTVLERHLYDLRQRGFE